MSTQTLFDTLLANIPKLDTSRKNWVTFIACFQAAVKAKGKWGHFDGSVPCLEELVAGARNALLEEGEDPENVLLTCQAEWDSAEDVAWYLLS